MELFFWQMNSSCFLSSWHFGTSISSKEHRGKFSYEEIRPLWSQLEIRQRVSRLFKLVTRLIGAFKCRCFNQLLTEENWENFYVLSISGKNFENKFLLFLIFLANDGFSNARRTFYLLLGSNTSFQLTFTFDSQRFCFFKIIDIQKHWKINPRKQKE